VVEGDLPIIITVLGGKRFRHNVQVDPRTEEDLNLLMNMDPNNPPTPKLAKLVKLYRQYDHLNKPIPIQVVGANNTDSYVHFGPSALQRELRYMPFVFLAIFLAFMAVASRFRYLKLSEQRRSGMGWRATAHQRGTPSSRCWGGCTSQGPRIGSSDTATVGYVSRWK
jgi:hypothetical protein